MSPSPIHQHRLPNGLWLLAEPIAGVQSLALTLLTPAGVAHEPAEQQGVGAVLSELLLRGAGGRDARQHSDALDLLGVQRSTGVDTHHLRVGAVMLADKLGDALPLLLDMVRRPHLPETALDPCRDLVLQELQALEDEPQQKVFVELRQRHYPQPLGRCLLGRREHVEALTLEQAGAFWRGHFVPDGSVLAFAGQFDWPRLLELTQRCLGDWSGAGRALPTGAAAPRGYLHRVAQSTQVHIGLAYHAPPEPQPESLLQRAAVAVLSGGMSGRLFTQVREKRGLCYSVFARYGSDKERGAVFAYAGTTAPRAQQTLEVLCAELRRLADGVEAGEFTRAIVGMKSGLVMQGESTSARAQSIASDQYILGRPRALAELAALVDSITLEKLNEYVRRNPPGEMTIVTIGPQELQAITAGQPRVA